MDILAIRPAGFAGTGGALHGRRVGGSDALRHLGYPPLVIDLEAVRIRSRGGGLSSPGTMGRGGEVRIIRGCGRGSRFTQPSVNSRSAIRTLL